MINLTNWTVDKTSVYYVDGKAIEIKTLSKEIQFQIETFDRFTQEYADLLYEQDKLKDAIEYKKLRITAMIKEYTKPKATGESDDTGKK